MADNLIQRGGFWHVRLDIPKDVQAALGNRRILSQTLHTGSRAEAMRLRLPLLAKWKAEIQAVRERKKAKGDGWREQAFETSKSLTNMLQNFTLDLTGIKPFQPTAEYLAEIEKSSADCSDDVDDSKTVSSTFTYDLRGKSLEQQLAELQRLAAWLRKAEKDHLLKEFSIPAPAVQELDSILSDHQTYKPKSPITKAMLDAWGSFLETQIKMPKTRDAHVGRMQRFSDFLTAEGLQIDFDTVDRWLVSISPARKTRANYISSGRSFWKWATKYNKQFREQFGASQCPFDNHDLPRQGDAAGRSYVAFTRAEVESLHTTALENGDVDLSFLIAIGAYTGARIEEIGRIRSEDIMVDPDGSPVGFRINASKTAAGIREVPLHSAIVPLFSMLLKEASANDGYLLKGGSSKYGVRLNGLSKRFSTLKSRMGFSDLHCFHSIRKTTTTELHRLGVTLEILPYILGHETKAFTLDVYSAGPSFAQKRDAINKLEYSFSDENWP